MSYSDRDAIVWVAREPGNKECVHKTSKPEVSEGHVQRISKLMALAIWFEELLSQGVVESQTALAELVHVSQPRMSQIMNLLLLAPDIQEELLFLPTVHKGRDPITEKQLRSVLVHADWNHQRKQVNHLPQSELISPYIDSPIPLE